MWQSQVIREWKAETQRSSLLKVLRARFQPELPSDLEQRIEQTADLDLLTRWFDAALGTPSLDVFRSVIQAAAPPKAQSS